jgi:hypothetical protein
MVVLGKGPQMLGEAPDTLGEERDLDFRRAGITVMDGVFRDEAFLRFPRERHPFLRN